MITQNENDRALQIDLHSPEMKLPGLQALLSKGFSVQTRVGGSLSELLCDQLGIDPDYLKHRVQTLFLNNSPVDDVDKTTVTDGDVVALSAAMPGLVGATMRKGGFYAKLRQNISYQATESGNKESTTGTVTIRLFNVIARELGPNFLKRGVKFEYQAVQTFLKLAAPVVEASSNGLTLDGKAIPIPAFLEKDRPAQMVRLTIRTR